MPGASSPLSLSVITRTLDVGIQRRMKNRTKDSTAVVPYSLKATHVSRQRILLNVFNTFYRNNDKEINASQIAMDLSIFGHRVIDDELHRLGVERHGITSGGQKIWELVTMLAVSIHSQSPLIEFELTYEGKYMYIQPFNWVIWLGCLQIQQISRRSFKKVQELQTSTWPNIW